MSRNRTYTDEQLKEIVPKCVSYAEVLRYFGLGIYGANHTGVKRIIKELGIDVSHFKGEGHNRGRKLKASVPARDLSELLVKDGPKITSNALKKRILNNKFLDNICSECKTGNEWQGKKLSLHLDHINGDNADNRIENLRMLCPNCHSQTLTYCRSKRSLKNMDKIRNSYNSQVLKERLTRPTIKIKQCQDCSAAILIESKRCKDCYHKTQKGRPGKPQFNWPPLAEVIERLKKSNYFRLGKELGVSDKAIRKFLNRHHISQTTLEPLPKPQLN